MVFDSIHLWPKNTALRRAPHTLKLSRDQAQLPTEFRMSACDTLTTDGGYLTQHCTSISASPVCWLSSICAHISKLQIKHADTGPVLSNFYDCFSCNLEHFMTRDGGIALD